MARRQFYRFRIPATLPSRAWQRKRHSNQPPGPLTEPPEEFSRDQQLESDSIPAEQLDPSPTASESAAIATPTLDPLEETSPSITEQSPPTTLPKTSKAGWNWSLVWLSVVLVCSGTGMLAAVWMTMLPPLPDCEQIAPLAADAERLYCAQQAANSGKLDQLLAGIALVQTWTVDHPLYNTAQPSLADWSRSILTIAEQKVAQNQLETAVELANKIPESSPLYEETQAAIAAWKQDWSQGETIYAKAQAAIKAQKWQDAWKEAQALSNLNNQHWQQRVTLLRQQIAVEKLAREQLQRAQKAAVANTPDTLVEAIALARKVTTKTYAHTDAGKAIQTWSQALLKLATTELDAKNYQEAIAIAEQVPEDAKILLAAQDLIRLSRAYQAADVDQMAGKPLHEQLWNLVTALEVVRQIGPDRPLYKVAKTQMARWEMQRQDLVHLQFAQTLANLQQVPTLKLAIEQANLIAPGRPQRVRAQTFIAHWRKEIQRIEDRPYLVQAQTLAKAGTINRFQEAIALASQIKKGRALRIEAQTAIATWKRQIQVIEDQPVLDQARTFANQGSLGKAIEVASNIRSGRALYEEAQAAIDDWTAQIQIAEDQPILNEAYALANQGNLSQAINVASQINYGRALYGEAQGAIGSWTAERDAILAAREAAARQAATESTPEPSIPIPESDAIEPEPTEADPVDAAPPSDSGSFEEPAPPSEPEPPAF